MWDERYSEPGYAYGTEANEFLVSVASKVPAGKVLCIGEGEGRNAVFLAERGFDVTAVDASEVGLVKAERLAAERGVSITTVVADLSTYEIPEFELSGIVSIFCHLAPSLRRDVHRRCVKGLQANGVFILEGFSAGQLEYRTGGPKTRELLYEVTELAQDFDGLAFDIMRESDRDLSEGTYHNGRASVIQVLGRKHPIGEYTQGHS